MLSTYADAFLEDILDDPDDDTSRLVYADWLEEHGDPDGAARAAFIRLQVERARLAADDPRRPAAAQRERALRDQYGARWAAPLCGLVRAFEFRRGFVEWVRLDAQGLLRHGEELFRRAPVRHLDLYVDRGQARAVADCPLLGRVRALDLGYPSGDPAGLAALLRSPHLGGLTALRLRSLSSGGVQGLARARHLTRLAALDLGANNLGPDGLEVLLGARLPALRALHLNANGLGDAGARRLAAAPLLGRLAALDLALNNVGPAGAEALAQSPYVGSLKSFWLGFNHAGDAGARALATSPRLALSRLYLGRNHLGAVGVLALAASPQMDGLTHLDLDYNEVPASALQALPASPYLRRLRSLYLRCGRGVTPRTRLLLERHFGPDVCRF